MTLGALQRKFAREVPRLIDKAHELGYGVTLGDAYRDPRVHGEMGQKVGYGRANSCHKVRLAIDLNLFLDPDGDGPEPLAYQTSTEAHRALGEWWEALSPENRWGGRWGDGNHYSKAYSGYK